MIAIYFLHLIISIVSSEKRCDGWIMKPGFGIAGSSLDVKTKWRIHHDHYINCTHIEGNLVIENLKPANCSFCNFDFLKTIEEVHGYVVIMNNLVSKPVELINLKIIRGYQLYDPQVAYLNNTQYALYIHGNAQPDNDCRLGQIRIAIPGTDSHQCLELSTTGPARAFC